jgi:hypothetical protein
MTELDWRRNPNGSIRVCPVAGWEAAVLGGTGVGVRLHLIRSMDKLASGEFEYETLVLTPTQAVELAGVLIKTAARIQPAPDQTSETPKP